MTPGADAATDTAEIKIEDRPHFLPNAAPIALNALTISSGEGERFVDASQTLAHKAVGGFVPKGNFGIWARNLMMKLLPLMPADMVLKEAYAAANAISI